MANYSAQYVFGITADTKAAQTQLQQLSKSLRDIQTKRINLTVDDTRITKAAEAAQLLQHELTKAMNVNTGQLDLSKLSQGLKAANTDIATLGRSLLGAGQQGQQAFSALVGTISAVNAPVKQLSRTITNLGTTLMNTIKWQASSSLIHGLMSTISGAISYARNLNETLNNIQIVTGQNDAQMAKFATTANRMAKELSTTTNDFAKASLIYYQQGDSAELAAKKAAITTKAANVAFTASAQEMSEMLTAVWNSFQIGEDHLEHAVDVLAKLGATTASSMEEMATGMQKVAATANTVGVSMEQMSAIVATSASVTRQAPETIGTAWNTILSRIGGLKLGETLEDGVDLNKYSKALQAVGVDILDASGNLREMGGVVDEIGEKWDNLTQAQKSALAQTIGGARQYTQILAFFENFDKYQQNLKTAQNADGALQEQQEIYAQGWEAASKRVRASMETLYSQIFNDKAITKMTSFFATIINNITSLTQSFGGIGNVVGLLATQFMESHIDVFSTKLVEIGNNIKQVFSGNAEVNEYANNIANLQQQMRDLQDIQLENNTLSDASQIELRYDIEILEIKKQIAEKQGQLTKEQLATADATLKNLQQDKEYYIQLANMATKTRETAANSVKDQQIIKMANIALAKELKGANNVGQATSGQRLDAMENARSANGFSSYIEDLKQVGDKTDEAKQKIDEAKTKLEELAVQFGILKDTDSELTLDAFNRTAAEAQVQLNNLKATSETFSSNFTNGMFTGTGEELAASITTALNAIPTDLLGFDGLKDKIEEVKSKLGSMGDPASQSAQTIVQLVQNIITEAITQATRKIEEFNKAAGDLNLDDSARKIQENAKNIKDPIKDAKDAAAQNLQDLKKEFEDSMKGASTSVQKFVTVASSAARIATAFNAIGNAINTWKDPKIDIWQKLLTTMTTLSTVAMAANSVMKMLGETTIKDVVATARDNAMKAAGIPVGTSFAAANLGVGASFKVAAAGAWAFMKAVLPLLAIGAVIAVIGLLANALNNAESAETKFEKQHSNLNKELDAQAKKTKTVISDISSLNSIMTDTNLTYSEQIDKINEITAAYGIQADAIDVVTGSYNRLSKKITDAALGKAALNLKQDTEAFNSAEKLVTSGMWKIVSGYSQGPGGGGQATTSTILDQNYFGVIGNNYASGYDTHYAASFYTDKAWSDYNGGKRDNRTNGFYNKRDADWRAEHYSVEGQFWHREDVQKKLASYGLYLDDSDNLRLTEKASPELLAQFQTEFLDNDQWAGQYKSEGSYTNQIRNSLRSKGLDSYQTALTNKRASTVSVSMLKHVDLTRDENNQMSTMDMAQLYNQIYQEARNQGAVDNAWEIYREIGSQLNFGGYMTGNNRIQSAMDIADTIGTTKQFNVEQKQNLLSDILNYQDKVLAWDNLDTGDHYEVVLTADLLMQINPTDIITDNQGNIVDIDSLAANMVATRQAELDTATTNDLLVSKKDTLTKKKISSDEYQELLDSGLFGHEENGEWIAGELGNKDDLHTWTLKSQGTREALWQQHYDSILDADITRLEDLSLAAGTYADQKEKELTNAIEGYTSTITGKDGQIAYEEDIQTRATKKTALTTGQNQQDLLHLMQDESTRNAALTEWVEKGYGSKDDFYVDDKFDSTKVTAKYSAVSESVRGLESEIKKLDESLIDVDERQIAMADARTAQEDAASRLAAKRNEQEVNNLEKITKKNTALNNTLGKKDKLSADQLTELKIYDQELYNLYNNASISAEEFDETVRQHLIKSLQDEAAAFKEAGDEESALIAKQQIEALELEKKTIALEKAKAAYVQIKATVAEMNENLTKSQAGIEILNSHIFDGYLSAVDKAKLMTAGLSDDIINNFENATSAEERAALIANEYSKVVKKASEINRKQNGVLNQTSAFMDIYQSDKSNAWSKEKLDDKNSWLSAIKSISRYKLTDEMIGALDEAYDAVSAKGFNPTINPDAFLAAVSDYLSNTIDKNNEAFGQIKATMIDQINAAYSQMNENAATAAQQQVEIWKAAFESIANILNGMAEGKSFSSMIIGDTDAAIAAMKQLVAQGDDWVTAATKVNNGIAGSELQTPELNTAAQYLKGNKLDAFLQGSYDENGKLSTKRLSYNSFMQAQGIKGLRPGETVTNITSDGLVMTNTRRSFSSSELNESTEVKQGKLEAAQKYLTDAVNSIAETDEQVAKLSIEGITTKDQLVAELLSGNNEAWDKMGEVAEGFAILIDGQDAALEAQQKYQQKKVAAQTALTNAKTEADYWAKANQLTNQWAMNESTLSGEEKARQLTEQTGRSESDWLSTLNKQMDTSYKSLAEMFDNVDPEIMAATITQSSTDFATKVVQAATEFAKIVNSDEGKAYGETPQDVAAAQQEVAAAEAAAKTESKIRIDKLLSDNGYESREDARKQLQQKVSMAGTTISDTDIDEDWEIEQVQAAADMYDNTATALSNLEKALTATSGAFDVLANSTASAAEKTEAYKSLADILHNYFGEFDISREFIDANTELIKEWANGSEEAMESLEKNILTSQLKQFGKDIAKCTDEIETLNNIANNLKFGEQVQKSDIKALISLQRQLGLTNIQMQQLLSTMGIASEWGQEAEQSIEDFMGQFNNIDEANKALEDTGYQIMTAADGTQKLVATTEEAAAAMKEQAGVAMESAVATANAFQMPGVEVNVDVQSNIAEIAQNITDVANGAYEAYVHITGDKVETETVTGDNKADLTGSGQTTVQVGDGDPVNVYGSVDIEADGQTKMTLPKFSGSGGRSNTTGNKPRGGGGGGGGKKQKTDHKDSSKEKERYHQINQQIGLQDKNLARLSTLKDRAYGGKYLKSMNQEIDALKEQNKLYEEKLRQVNANIKAEEAELRLLGATFASDGTLDYESYMDSIIAEYNEAVDIYNESKQEDADKEALKEAEKLYDKRKTLMEHYEEDLNLIEELNNSILEQQNKISQNILEGIQYKLELKVELNDRDIKYLQYIRERWDDTFTAAGKSMGTLLEEEKLYEKNLAALAEAKNEADRQHAAGELFDKDYVEALKAVNEKSLEFAKNLYDTAKEAKETYANMLDKANEELQKHTSVLSHTNEIVGQYLNMMKLMGRGTDYKKMAEMYKVQFNSINANIEAQKQYVDTLKETKERLDYMIESAGGYNEVSDIVREEWDITVQKIAEGETELNNLTQSSLEKAKEMFKNTCDEIISKFDEVLFKQKDGLTHMESDYQYYQKEQERYLSTAKELYEVSKLNRQIEASIRDATTQQSKERLKALQQEIKLKSESGRLTEYDAQMLELQYKYALALQAVEDKANAKSVVRLTRDDNGNYGYQYTADQNEIDKANQELEDILQQINELAADRQESLVQERLSLEREYRDGLQSILDDENLSHEEQMERMEELTKRHAENLQYIQEQYQNAQYALIYNQGVIQERYKSTILANTGLIQDQMNMSMQEVISRTTAYTDYLNALFTQGGDIYEAFQQYKKDLGIVETISGNSWDGMTASLEEYNKQNDEAVEKIATVADQLETTIGSVLDATTAWVEHADTIAQVTAQYEALAIAAASAIRGTAGDEFAGEDITSIVSRVQNSYATGGLVDYTGLAWVDGTKTRPELMLNANDTVNLLHAVDTVRTLDTDWQSIYNQLTQNAYGMLYSMSRLFTPHSVHGEQGELQQNVHITAEFPNATDRVEISAAFEDLVNLASQYANRK